MALRPSLFNVSHPSKAQVLGGLLLLAMALSFLLFRYARWLLRIR